MNDPMPKSIPTSFPFFDLARRKGVPYAMVLHASERKKTDLPSAIASEARSLAVQERTRRHEIENG